MKPPIFKTKDFILRPFCLKDATNLVKNINDKRIAAFTLNIPHPYGPKDAKEWLIKQEKRNKDKNSDSLHWAIEIGGVSCGGISLNHISLGHKAELGYWLGSGYWGKGIMTKAAKIVINFGFKELKLRRIWAGCFTNNPASRRVLEKNGLKLEGLFKKVHLKNGRLLDDYIFARVK